VMKFRAREPNRIFKLCNGLALILCALTYVLFEHIPHYAEIPGELMTNPSFDEGLLGWQSSKYVSRDQVGTIDLSNSIPTEVQSVWQVIPVPESRALKVSAFYSTRNVKQGIESWHNARLGLGGRVREGAWQWDFKGTVFARTGTTSLGQATGIVLIPDDIEELRVEFELGGGTGEFRVHEIETAMVTLLPYIPKLMIVLQLGWGLLALVVLWTVIRAGFWLLVPGAGLMIFLLLIIPRSQKELLLHWSHGLWPTIWEFDYDHLLLFLFFSALVAICLRISHVVISRFQILVCLVMTAISLEVLQYFTQFRSANLNDTVSNILWR
jgi:hypothetical protein